MSIFHISPQNRQKVPPDVSFALRCPSCRQIGTFETPISDLTDLREVSQGTRFGHRICPNTTCHAHVFAVLDNSGNVVVTYPPELLDFDTAAVPDAVVSSMTEALVCHAHGAMRGSALMIRRTLEDLCADRGADGENLLDRIHALADLVVVPPELLSGVDNLRLLGNDAAHVKARDYEDIGDDEVALAIEVTKELIKSVYQFKDLVAKLEALKSRNQEE